MPIIFLAADPPDPSGVRGARAACAVRFIIFRAFQLRVPHALDRNQSLFSGIDTIENDPVQADVQRLLDDPLGLIGLGRKTRKQREVRLEGALLENRGLVCHSHQEQVKPRKIQRVVLQVGVHKIDRRARDFAGICEG